MSRCPTRSHSSRRRSRMRSTWCTPRSPPSGPSRRTRASDVGMPRLSDSMEEGTVLKWLVEEGGEVKRGEPLVEIETDKANMTYEADTDGVLIKVLAQEGDTLPVGDPIAEIGEEGEAPSGGGSEEEGEAPSGGGSEEQAEDRETDEGEGEQPSEPEAEEKRETEDEPDEAPEEPSR